MIVKLLRGFAYVWFCAAGAFILLNLLSIWYFQGFSRLQEILSPYNVANFVVTVITLSPGIGAYLLAQKLEQRGAGSESVRHRHAESYERVDAIRSSAAPDILALYGDLLQDRSRLLLPESSLPASKDTIKEALLAEAKRNRGDTEFQRQYVATLRTCYALLADFVPDHVAERNSDLTPDGLSSVQGAGGPNPALQSDDVKAATDDMARLMVEFDAHLAKDGV